MKYAYMRYVVDEEENEKSEDVVQNFADKEVEKATSKLKEEHSKALEDQETKIKEYTEKVEAVEKENNELKTKAEEVEVQIKEYTEKVEGLENENKELKTFKEEIEKQEKENKINYAINSVKDSLTEEQIKDWQDKVKEFESVESFTNAIQAFAYTQNKNINKEEDIKIHIPIPNQEENKGLWG